MSVLKKADYIVAGAPFENSTTEAADIVLPTALWLETEGTYNGRLLRPVAEPPGGALSFGVILHQIAQYMGYILPPVSIGKVLPRVELNEETVKALVRAAEKDAPEPAVCSTPIVYGDGSITDNMQWIQLQERNAW